MTLGSVLTFSPLMHSPVAQDLLVLSLRFTEPRFCWSEEMTPGIFSSAPTKVDVIHVGEGLHLSAGFFQEGLDCKAEEEEGSHGVTLSDTPTACGNWVCTSDEQV